MNIMIRLKMVTSVTGVTAIETPLCAEVTAQPSQICETTLSDVTQ